MSRIPVTKILDLWFARSGASVSSAAKATMPSIGAAYFKRDTAFDDECRTYEPYIDQLIDQYHAHPITFPSPFAEPELAAGGSYPNDKEESLAQILLLDQFTRNIYRGPAAKKVYTVTDPIARSLSLHAISKKWHEEWHWLANIFLTLPLVHSEIVECHLLASQASVTNLIGLAKKVKERSADRKELQLATSCLESQSDHLKIVNKFGRYPYRNEVIGRESTADEIKYVKEGGESFGSSG